MKIYTYSEHTRRAGEICRENDPETLGADVVEHEGSAAELLELANEMVKHADSAYRRRLGSNLIAELA